MEGGYFILSVSFGRHDGAISVLKGTDSVNVYSDVLIVRVRHRALVVNDDVCLPIQYLR
jgi:hypothetical protein